MANPKVQVKTAAQVDLEYKEISQFPKLTGEDLHAALLIAIACMGGEIVIYKEQLDHKPKDLRVQVAWDPGKKQYHFALPVHLRKMKREILDRKIRKSNLKINRKEKLPC